MNYLNKLSIDAEARVESGVKSGTKRINFERRGIKISEADVISKSVDRKAGISKFT